MQGGHNNTPTLQTDKQENGPIAWVNRFTNSRPKILVDHMELAV